jgi:hypothetical protein
VTGAVTGAGEHAATWRDIMEAVSLKAKTVAAEGRRLHELTDEMPALDSPKK